MSFCGLFNKSANICYVNAIIQALFPIIKKWAIVILDVPPSYRHSETGSSITLETYRVAEFIHAMKECKRPLDARIVRDLIDPSHVEFKENEQADAIQFLERLLEKVHEPALQSYFKIPVETMIYCTRCGEHNIQPATSYYMLYLDLSHAPQKTSVSSLLKLNQDPDVIERKCEYSTQCASEKKTRNESLAYRHLVYPLRGVIVALGRKIVGANKKHMNSVSVALKETFVTFEKTARRSQVKKLRSVVVHTGRKSESGHFYAFVKQHGEWWKHNDESTSLVTFNDVQKENSNICLLFYD